MCLIICKSLDKLGHQGADNIILCDKGNLGPYYKKKRFKWLVMFCPVFVISYNACFELYLNYLLLNKLVIYLLLAIQPAELHVDIEYS